MDLTDTSSKLRDQISNVSSEKVSRAQQIVVEAIISAWQVHRKDSLTDPFPEPDINHYELYDTAPGSPDNYVNISWAKRASLRIEGTPSNPGEVVCIIYTFDSRNHMSPPMHFRLKGDDMRHARALSIAIEHVLRHIDLFNYQDNFGIFNDQDNFDY